VERAAITATTRVSCGWQRRSRFVCLKVFTAGTYTETQSHASETERRPVRGAATAMVNLLPRRCCRVNKRRNRAQKRSGKVPGAGSTDDLVSRNFVALAQNLV
jgi:hypothetical protein